MRIRYRGWKARPFIRWRPIKIGHQPLGTLLYCVGPLAIFVDGPSSTPKHREPGLADQLPWPFGKDV